MPRNKNGHNQSHNVKQQNNHTHGRTFTDNREQQLRQAKFLEQKQKKQIKEESRLAAQRQLEQRVQQEQPWEFRLGAFFEIVDRNQGQQKEQAQLNVHTLKRGSLLEERLSLLEGIVRELNRDRMRLLFAPHFIRHRGQQNQPFVERQEPANQDNHFNTGRQCPRVFR